jgi:hypothetical protein
MDLQYVILALLAFLSLIARLIFRYLMRNHPKEIIKDGEHKKFR